MPLQIKPPATRTKEQAITHESSNSTHEFSGDGGGLGRGSATPSKQLLPLLIGSVLTGF